MSFRLKTILGIAFIETVLLLVLIFSGLNFLNESNQEQLRQRVETINRLVAISIKNAVVTTDLTALENFVKEMLHNPDIIYTRISSSSSDAVLAEGGRRQGSQRSPVLDHQLSDVDDGVFDIEINIIDQGKVFGVVAMGISIAPIEIMYAKAMKWTFAIASIQIILVTLFSFMLGTYLTAQLQRLKQASKSIAETGPGLNIEVVGNDEIAQLTHAFNRMSSSLYKSYDALNLSLCKEIETSAIAGQTIAKNKAILSASLDAIITIKSTGEVLDFNEVAVKTFGWSQQEITGGVLADFIIPKEKRAMHNMGIKNYLKSGASPVIGQRLELSALHKNGHVFPIEITISPIKTEQGTMFTAFIRDITERLKAETELQLAAKTFDSSEAIFICSADNRIIRTNNAFTRITGYQQDEVLGKNPRIFASGKHDDKYYQAMWLALLDKGEWSGEIYNKRKNGEIFPEYLNISSVTTRYGEFSHFIAHFMDISEQKYNEMNLKKARKAAETSNVSKSRFLASMSHEIRTPLNAVLGILGLLKDSQLDHEQLKLVQTGRDSGELLLSIINDILDFSKIDVDKLHLEHAGFHLHHLLQSTTALLKQLAENKSLILNLSIADDLPKYAKGDADRIRQILINLINNAIKFTASGSVSVNARLDNINDDKMILRCQVIDTGIGISRENQQGLFDEFTMVDQTHSRRYEGTGLGLAICKRLVTLMHGNMSIESQLGGGSTFQFCIELDRATKDDAKDALHNEQVNILPDPNTRILLAEDNSANQMVIKSILESVKLQVDIVANGLEAIDAVKRIPYDIVLMDISMPEMDGMTATRKIRQLTTKVRDIPIVALTAHSLKGDKERFIQAGMNDYLSKPMNKALTLTCIARLTAHQRDEDSDSSVISAQDNYLDESVLQQLVTDTSVDIIEELISFYIQDTKDRMKLVNAAIATLDFKAIEFQVHTIGSSAASHGNIKLFQLSKDVELLCKTNQHQQVIEQAKKINDIAEKSFDLLDERVQQGF